jgi:hypothetical protein
MKENNIIINIAIAGAAILIVLLLSYLMIDYKTKNLADDIANKILS